MACLLLICLFTVLQVSCGKGSPSGIPLGEQELLDMVLKGAKYVVGRDSDSPLVAHAEVITVYEGGRDAEMQTVSFSQGDSLSGRCDHASVNRSGDHATLSGDVTLIHRDDDGTVTIKAREMDWDGENKVFICDGEVQVSYSDGTTVRAVGFSANADENLYEFGEILEGSLVK